MLINICYESGDCFESHWFKMRGNCSNYPPKKIPQSLMSSQNIQRNDRRFFFFFFLWSRVSWAPACVWLKSDCPSRCHKRLNGPVALCNDMVAISRHSPMVNDSASSLFHAIVQLLMGPAATCPPYSVIRHGNGTFTPLEQQMTSFWQAIGRHNAHNTPTTFKKIELSLCITWVAGRCCYI